MKRLLPWLIVATVLIIGLVVYCAHSGDRLNVAPEAERAIDKAKQQR